MWRIFRCNWLLYCLLVFILSRIVMLYQFNLASEILNQVHSNFFTAMCKWDCKWYLTIINNGYDLSPRTFPKIWAGLANWAFFPLYPYAVKGIIGIISSSAVATGIVLNQIFLLLSLCVFYKYLKIKFDEFDSRFGVFLLGFSPFNVYFASLYTEALFLLLSLSAFYFMSLNRPFISSILGGLLSATRPVGVMFVVPILYNQFKKFGIKFSLVFYFVLSMSGLIIYMLYLHFHTGDFLAFEHVQRGWGRKGWDFDHIGQQLLHMWHDKHNLFIFLISVGLSVVLFYKKFIEEALFNFMCILPGFMTGQIMSEGRFSGTLFTFYLGVLLLTRRSRSLRLIAAMLFMLLFSSYYLYWLAHASFLV